MANLSKAMHNNKPAKQKHKLISRFWIIGAGRFGQLAITRLKRHFPEATLTVVDEREVEFGVDKATFIRANALEWLSGMLTANAPMDMLVPAIPVHVAAKWIVSRLEKRFDVQPLAVEQAWIDSAPNAMRGAHGQAYVSHANFLCPDNCPEPRDRCTHTGLPRPMDMFRLLEKICPDGFVPIVLRSHQLAPGVGGITKDDLIQAKEAAFQDSHKPLMIATACRCHGVVDFMRLDKPL